jgi:hypothetical protein
MEQTASFAYLTLFIKTINDSIELHLYPSVQHSHNS